MTGSFKGVLGVKRRVLQKSFPRQDNKIQNAPLHSPVPKNDLVIPNEVRDLIIL
jgi:hypothetical protein